MAKDKLTKLRERIDDIDGQLIELLNDRANCSLAIGEVKSKDADGDGFSAFRPEREAQVLQHIRERNAGPLSDAQIEQIFREVISISIAFQQPLNVAYLGPSGTYTQSAALKQFGHSTNVRAQPSIVDVFHAVESEASHFGVVPVENSTEGSVNQTLDCFIDSQLRVCAEVNLPIHHAFMTKHGAEDSSIKRIYSHEQSLAQCRNWLREHYPDIPKHAVASNAEAARLVQEEEGAAAIAGELAADQFQLQIVHARIEDKVSNSTRFFVLGKRKIGPSGTDKTSLLVYAANRAGSLVDILTPFQQHDISLTRVVSRPAPAGNWSYVFFIDFDGHEDEALVQEVLEEVRAVAFDVKVLGSYPRALAE